MSSTTSSYVATAPAAPQSTVLAKSTDERPRPRLPRWALAGGLAGVLIAITLIWRATSENAICYETLLIERGPIQAFVTTTGTLNAVVDVQVGSQVSGNIKAPYADFNTKVKKSQLVALIDPAIFQSQVRQAEATLSAAHTAVVAAEAQVVKAKADLSVAIANEKNMEAIVVKDTASAINARNQWERQDALFKDGIISQQDHDSAKATYDAAEAQAEVSS